MQELLDVAIEDVISAHLPRFLSELHVEALLFGNITAEEAQQLGRQVHKLLGGSTMSSAARIKDRTRMLPAGVVLFQR